MSLKEWKINFTLTGFMRYPQESGYTKLWSKPRSSVQGSWGAVIGGPEQLLVWQE